MSVPDEAGVGARLAVTWRRLALIGGMVGLGAVLVINIPGLAEVRRYRAPAAVLSHLAMGLTALGLSAHVRGWVARVAALSSRRRVFALVAALVGPMTVIVAGLVVAPRYGHELFTREWGLVEPLQFVLWLTAAWLALERARVTGSTAADRRLFRLGAWGCLLLALEEVDYLGLVTLLARAAGVPGGRIGRHHIGGIHDVINDLGKVSLVLGLSALAALVAAVVGWASSQGLHRVLVREAFSITSLPLAGTVGFLAVSQLADIDHPVMASLFGRFVVIREIREEPMELLAAVCANASLLAKLAPWVRPPEDS